MSWIVQLNTDSITITPSYRITVGNDIHTADNWFLGMALSYLHLIFPLLTKCGGANFRTPLCNLD